MSTVSQELSTVNAVDLTVAAADFAAFCKAVRSEFPAWGRSAQIMRKATHQGPVTRVSGLGGRTFSANDVAVIRAIAARYQATPAAQPFMEQRTATRRSLPSMKFGRSTTWAGVAR